MLGLISAAASDIVNYFQNIAPLLQCPIITDEFPSDYFEDAKYYGSRGCEILFNTAQRLFGTTASQWRVRRESRITRLPWNDEETNGHTASRYRVDGADFMRMLSYERLDARSLWIWGSIEMSSGLHLNSFKTVTAFR